MEGQQAGLRLNGEQRRRRRRLCKGPREAGRGQGPPSGQPALEGEGTAVAGVPGSQSCVQAAQPEKAGQSCEPGGRDL